MKKTIAFLLIALLTLSFSAAFADSVPMSKEDQMVGLVKSFLEENPRFANCGFALRPRQ